MGSDWQIVATVALIAIAALVVMRRVIRLFFSSEPTGCQTGGCSSCPSAKPGASNASGGDFVSLETLISSAGPKKSSRSPIR
jgi:hypothetical protein